MKIQESAKAATINACKLCNPLGASLVFRGIEGAIPILHGSQGCATYIRRYIISHFKEPIDIASSSFNESSTIFGGGRNLTVAIENVIRQYHPGLIGVATTCLSETIGEDIPMILHCFVKEFQDHELPEIVSVSTPSYQGSHLDGFHAAVLAVVQKMAQGGPGTMTVNLFPGMVSTSDLRYLKQVFADFGLKLTLLPDYSETMDGPTWDDYQKIPQGGTSLEQIRNTGRARAAIQLGLTVKENQNAARFLKEKFNIPDYQMGLPIGIRETDRFLELLAQLSNRPIPEQYQRERGRLVDAYIDGHKYLFGKKAVLFGEPDLVVGMAAFLAEVGVVPVLCATGTETGCLEKVLRGLLPENCPTKVLEGVDFNVIGTEAASLKPDLLIGNSKGYSISRNLRIPLVRVGFPIHDRIGGQRVLHLGYSGTQQLFDTIVNELIRSNQEQSPVGYSYM